MFFRLLGARGWVESISRDNLTVDDKIVATDKTAELKFRS
jgi:hypothetical protein